MDLSTPPYLPRDPSDEILLVHMGGLGDICLSESIFFSLSQEFSAKNMTALGYPRFLRLFGDYFTAIGDIESRKWIYLFANDPGEVTWERIVFIGKDKDGVLRKRWQTCSRQPLLFIDMYPDGDFEPPGPKGGYSAAQDGGVSQLLSIENNRRQTGRGEEERGLTEPPTSNSAPRAAVHIEDYQLMQLANYGIAAMKKEVPRKTARRVILYPEAGFKKLKWPAQQFMELYKVLKGRDFDVHLLQSLDLKLDQAESLHIEDLGEVKRFFEEGGVFVSNDSGMAHLAGACGCFTITIFNDVSPVVWHPRGRNVSLRYGQDVVTLASLEALIAATVGKRGKR